MDSCTLTGNGGSLGAGISIISGNNTALHITNSILTGNGAADSNGDIYISDPSKLATTVFSGGHNLVGRGNAAAAFTGAGDRTGVAVADLKLGALGDNGGPTPTISLGAGSIALDSGASELNSDQRGLPRPAGSAADVGAFEALSTLPLIVTSVKLGPDQALTGATLTAVPTVDNSNGHTLVLHYSWTCRRGGTTTTLGETSDTLLAKYPVAVGGDKITVTVFATDGAQQSQPVSASVILGFSPIHIKSYTFRPKAPYNFDKMAASFQVDNPDHAPLTFLYAWAVNNVTLRFVAATSNNQDSFDLKSHCHAGDQISLVAQVTKGDFGDMANLSATVQNSIPVMTALSLAPQSPTPKSAVVITYGGHDADGDKLTKIIVWKINGKVLPTEKGSILNLAKYPKVKAGDVVSAEMRLSDGAALSKTLKASVTVAAVPAASPAVVSSDGSSHAS